MNASWMGDFVRVYHNVDINVAVQTPGGLMVPFVADADAKGLSAISAEIKALAAKVGRGAAGARGTPQQPSRRRGAPGLNGMLRMHAASDEYLRTAHPLSISPCNWLELVGGTLPSSHPL